MSTNGRLFSRGAGFHGSGGRTYEIDVAFDLPLTFTIAGKYLQIADELGLPIPVSSATSFQHMSAAPTQKSLTFTVVNRTN